MTRRDGARPVLSAEGLAIGYDGIPLVEGIDLEFRAGEVVSLIGPNGTGKSTLLRTLSGSLVPVAGRVVLDGRPLAGMPASEIARKEAVLLTERLSTELMTCEDVVEAGRYPHTGRLGVLAERDHEAVRAAMELVDVWGLRAKDFMEASDGQRQRVLIARAIAQEPQVLLLDEPSTYLDIRYQIELLHVLRCLASEREVAIVMSVHELELARRVSDRVVCLKAPRVFASGPAEEIFDDGVIDALYGLVPGSYDARTGAIDLDVPGGCMRGGGC